MDAFLTDHENLLRLLVPVLTLTKQGGFSSGAKLIEWSLGGFKFIVHHVSIKHPSNWHLVPKEQPTN